MKCFLLDGMTRHNAWGRFAPPPFCTFLLALGQHRASTGDCDERWFLQLRARLP